MTPTDTIRLLYALSHLLAVASFGYSGVWRRLPFCFLMLCVSSILAITYAPESRQWITGMYLSVEPVAVAFRYAAAVEAVWIMASSERFRIIAGFSLIAACLAVMLWTYEPGSAVYGFVQFRRYAQIGTALFFSMALFFLWWHGLLFRDGGRIHSAILLVLLWKQTVYSVLSIRGPWTTMRQWQAADWPGLLISSLCCLLWAGLAIWRLRVPKQ